MVVGFPRIGKRSEGPLYEIDVAANKDKIRRILQLKREKKQAFRLDKPQLAQYLAQQPHIEGPTEVDPELAQRIKSLIPWPANERQYQEGAKLISDELVESVGCYGDEDECRARIRAYMKAGATMPIAFDGSKENIDLLASGF